MIYQRALGFMFLIWRGLGLELIDIISMHVIKHHLCTIFGQKAPRTTTWKEGGLKRR